MNGFEKLEINNSHEFIRREEYREDITRIETRVNSLAESQAMTSVAMQSMNQQMVETNKKIDNLSMVIINKIENIDGNLKTMATNRSFQNGAIMMLLKVFSFSAGACGFLVTLDYVGLIKTASKFWHS